ncbi:MAG: endonuclease, partial [Muribaculaceae bacterium]|nr:endonuclease [Muribaculaceae bacterium]
SALPQYFQKTDVYPGTRQWWDMYSNFAIPVTTHESLNIEHSVANSWFGAKKGCEDAYSDLFHLNPSDQDANNHKSNWPLGEVSTVSWENGLVKLGTPKAGTAGSATTVFEPADEYKGDFARAYFYIFTAYNTAPWIANQPMYNFEASVALEPWAVEMLCRWAKEDPVDSKEINRNEEIYKIQKNRNPFIDYPELIDYIWGDKKAEAFTPGEAASAIDRPAEPVFTGCRVIGVNKYHSRWWEPNTVAISHEAGDLWVSVNGGDYEQYGPGVSVPAATTHGAVHSLAAYTATEHNGKTFRSSVATLTLTARDPEKDDYTEALYVPVETQADFRPDNDTYYVI